MMHLVLCAAWAEPNSISGAPAPPTGNIWKSKPLKRSSNVLSSSFCQAPQPLTSLCLLDGTEVHTAVLKLQVFHSKSPVIYAVFEGWIFGFRELPVVWISIVDCEHNEGHGLPWTLPVPVHLAMTCISGVAAVHLCRLGHMTPADDGVLDHMLAVNWERKIQHLINNISKTTHLFHCLVLLPWSQSDETTSVMRNWVIIEIVLKWDAGIPKLWCCFIWWEEGH